MGDFKIIMIIMPGIQTLVQFIVCNAVEQIVTDVPAVISMNYLAHQPEIFFLGICESPHCFHETEIKTVRAVKTNSINLEFINPKSNHIQKVIPHCRLLEI